MPQFAESKIEVFNLPSSTKDDPAVVKVDLTVTGGLAEDMFDSNGQMVGPVSSVLASSTKEWNFTDAAGKTVPITRENVRRLRPEDFNFLSEKIMPQLNVVATAQVGESEKKD